jgi:transcriptional accessory protein Tex/SPT6
MKILGVDPGIKGGCAVVVVNDGAAPDIVDIIDIPAVASREQVALEAQL